MSETFRVLDAARAVVDQVNRLIDGAGPLLYEDQLRNAAQSIAANIREARGRRLRGEKNQFYGYARGSAEEVDEHLRSNLMAGHLPESTFWAIRNRLTIIRRMLSRIIGDAQRPRRSDGAADA